MGRRSWLALNQMVKASPEGYLPATLKSILAYTTNMDFFRGGKVWKGREVMPEDEYYATTPDIWVKIGKTLGISPVRAQRAFGFVVPRNSYLDLAGIGLDVAAGQTAQYQEQEGVTPASVLSKTPVAKRFFRTTPPLTEALRDRQEEIAQEYNSRKQAQDRRVDEAYKAYLSGDKQAFQSLRLEAFKEMSPDERERAVQRFERGVKFGNEPDISWWHQVMDLKGPARGELLYERYRRLPEEKRADFIRTGKKIRAWSDSEAVAKFNQLQRGK